MATKHQKITIKLPKSYKPATRMAIAQEVIDQIITRTQKNRVDKNGTKFKPGYSKQYADSPEGKAGSKKKGQTPNLTLSGDMMAQLRLLSESSGEITIGYKKGTNDNAKADGNIRGTYGQKKPDKGKSRDFLGITQKELNAIKAKYPIRDIEKQKERLALMDFADKTTSQITGAVAIARLEEEEE